MPILLEPKSEYLIMSGHASGIGDETDKKIQEDNLHIAESAYLFSFSSCYEMLFEIARDCSEPGWDGYDAVPISGEVYLKIFTLINNFSIGLQAPELVPENDGAITLEWHKNHKQEISISINPNNIAYYACLDGSEKKHGSCVLQESLPPFLINMIDQILDS
ncbi:MAG: hypothetical protein ABH836_08350 [Candidatus Omnitrophota bacterium]